MRVGETGAQAPSRLGFAAALLLSGGALACTFPAHAEEVEDDGASADSESAAEIAPSASESADGRQVYQAAFFARFAPRNALDMVSQVPGFILQQEDQGRGLGQARQNVLVNNERPASKSEGIGGILSRIPAARVERIELVDGASLGIPGLSGQVANVVTKGGGMTGRFEYRAIARPKYARPSFGGGEVSLSGTDDNLEWTAAFTHGVGRGGAGGNRGALITDGLGNLTETRDSLIFFKGEFPQLSGRIKWTSGGGTIVNAHALYGRSWTRFVNNEDRDSVSGVDTFRAFDNIDNGYNYEIGGDLDFALGPGRLKLIALDRFNRGAGPATSIVTYADARPATGSQFAQVRKTGERIGRAEYSWSMLGGTWEIDGEAAFNRYDSVASFGTLDTTGTFNLAPFAGATGGVTEDRYEGILTHGRALAPNLQLQLGAGVEYSKLAQTGGAGLTREFWRPKGSLTLGWTPGSGWDVSLKAARTVGQLSFGDFLANVDLAQANSTSGNVELVPQQAWEFDLEAKKALGAWGSATLRGYTRHITDYIDWIPVPGGESRGNIDGSARLLGLALNATINFDPIGWKGAKLTASARYENTRLHDPLTGVLRPFSNQRRLASDGNLRWDIPATDWALGLGYTGGITERYVRLTEVGRNYEGPLYTLAFVEHKDVLGMTVNLQVFNLTRGNAFNRRTVYTGLRDRSSVSFNEDRKNDVSQIFRLMVKGNF